MGWHVRHALALSALLLASASGPAIAEEAGDSFTGVARVIAFADVHGAYDELTALLRLAGVVDAELHWAAGNAHVVSLGDLLDRGAGSRNAMELLMRLQTEAVAGGGAVHVVLGNHEAMNLLGDLRDATTPELANYVADEPAGVREKLRSEWIAQHGDASAAQFDERFPPGWFGHRAVFAPDGRYGRWLLSLPVAIVIDDTLYMHGGPSPVLAGLSIGDINKRYHAALTEYLNALDALMSAGLVHVEDAFAERAALADQRLGASPPADAAEQQKLADAVKRFTLADRDSMLDADG